LVYILFVIGFILLIKGADWLIKGSASLAKRFRVSDMVIGLTVVSIGTSAPELIVNVIASINGNSGIAIGNIFGSNISNVLLILGLTAIVYPIPIRKNTIRTDIPFVLVATLLVGFLANAQIIFWEGANIKTELYFSFWDGLILLLFFGIFLIYAFQINKRTEEIPELSPEAKSPAFSSFLVLIGIACLFFGGKWVVEGAVNIAAVIGLSEGFVGLTIVAVGTSLPELVTSVIAARQKNVDIAVGNIVGSNIFNLLWVIGISAMINPLKFTVLNNVDILVMLFTSILILLVVTLNKRFHITRLSGFIFVGFYLAYIVYLFYRG